MRTLIWILVAIAVIAAGWYLLARTRTAPVPTPQTTLANPASVNCTNVGGVLEIVEEAGGQTGYCHLPDGRVCEEWALYRSNSCTPPGATSTPAATSTR